MNINQENNEALVNVTNRIKTDTRNSAPAEAKELLNTLDTVMKTFEKDGIEAVKKIAKAATADGKQFWSRSYAEQAKILKLDKEYNKAKLAETKKRNMEATIELYKYISEEKQKERDLDKKIVETEVKLYAKNNKITAEKKKELEKELKQAKKKKNDYQDKTSKVFKDAFSKFNKELSYTFKHNVAKTSAENLMKVLKGVGNALNKSVDAVNSSIQAYAKYQTSINSRLQGRAGNNTFGKISKSFTENGVAYSPLLKTEALYANIAELANQGIATNLEQRAFIETTKEGIANTFSVTDSSLKRMIKIQQNDSTAARLGMESFLTKFLNTYVENTEYLTTTFDNVAASLLEASALLGSADKSAEFEYTVQKWLGGLTGLGLSETTAQNLATAIGQLGSGDVEAVNGSGIQNLLIMAANKVNLQYADLLAEGIDSNQADQLMYGVVQYLQELATMGNNVVKNQLGKLFGITVSDLVAVNNIAESDLKAFYDTTLSYNDMYAELGEQYEKLKERMGISNILDNLFANINYQTGMKIASSPGQFATWKVTDMIQKATGGINIPYITALGSGVDLEATVEQLMKLTLVGANTLGNIGKIVSGINSIKSGATLLDALKINANTAQFKTTGGGKIGRPTSRRTPFERLMTSEAAYVGNESGNDYAEGILKKATEDSQRKLDEQKKNYKDPIIEYLDKEVKLGSAMTDLTSTQNKLLLATNGIGAIMGVKVNSNTNSKTTANALETTGNNPEELITTQTTNVSNTSAANIGNYLDKIQFDDGFKSLVDNVAAINNKITGNSSNPKNSNNNDITGLTDNSNSMQNPLNTLEPDYNY